MAASHLALTLCGSAYASTLTEASLAGLLQEGVATRSVPVNLVPSLAQARHDYPLAWHDGCLLGRPDTDNNAGCVFGDTRSKTTVVLFGDSHAVAWFPAVEAVSEQQHWRLIVMGKAGCPPADVLVRTGGGSPFTACVTWRHNSEQQIRALHPAMVVVTSSHYRAWPLAGVPAMYANTWLNGLAATFQALRHAATHVVFIDDVPRLKQSAVGCIAAHISDVFPCTVARQQAFQWPTVRPRELNVAKTDEVVGIDPAPWFCTADRCPVIVDDMLMFRDAQHITPEWSAFLAPVLGARLVDAIR